MRVVGPASLRDSLSGGDGPPDGLLGLVYNVGIRGWRQDVHLWSSFLPIGGTAIECNINGDQGVCAYFRISSNWVLMSGVWTSPMVVSSHAYALPQHLSCYDITRLAWNADSCKLTWSPRHHEQREGRPDPPWTGPLQWSQTHRKMAAAPDLPPHPGLLPHHPCR